MAEKKRKGLHKYLGGLSGQAGGALEGRAEQLRRQEEAATGKRTGDSSNDNSGGRKGRK